MRREDDKRDILYIVIPAYNEESNIEKTVEDWYPIVQKHNGKTLSRLLIINDGSTDESSKLIDKMALNHGMLHVLTKENGGHGQAVLDGYRYALDAGADYIFQTDSDGQTSADEFEGFWRQRKRFDIIIGNRYRRKDGLKRALISKTEAALLACFMRVYVTDPNTPYRLMNAKSLENVIRFIDSDEQVPNMMLSAAYKKIGYKVLYKDIVFKKRKTGRNSININNILKIGLHSIRRIRELNRRIEASGL